MKDRISKSKRSPASALSKSIIIDGSVLNAQSRHMAISQANSNSYQDGETRTIKEIKESYYTDQYRAASATQN